MDMKDLKQLKEDAENKSLGIAKLCISDKEKLSNFIEKLREIIDSKENNLNIDLTTVTIVDDAEDENTKENVPESQDKAPIEEVKEEDIPQVEEKPIVEKVPDIIEEKSQEETKVEEKIVPVENKKETETKENKVDEVKPESKPVENKNQDKPVIHDGKPVYQYIANKGKCQLFVDKNNKIVLKVVEPKQENKQQAGGHVQPGYGGYTKLGQNGNRSTQPNGRTVPKTQQVRGGKPSDFAALPINDTKKDTSKKKVADKGHIEKTEKGGLSNRDLFKKGYTYDTSRENYDEDDDGYVRIKNTKKGVKKQDSQKIEITEAELNSEIIPIKTFSEKIGKPATELVKKFFELGKMITINSNITFEEAELIALDYGITLTLNVEKTAEDKLSELVKTKKETSGTDKRPPVVTIMGHVDHGKTSLLDYIRKTNVIATEAGGITQHIGAYTIDVNGEKITFLDTPGHEAFTSMRRRGAQVADIGIIVVSLDDSIMPQTVEAISHAKDANIQIIVAANKIDKIPANERQQKLDKLYTDLSSYDLLPEKWGGDAIVCPISAKTGEGVNELLDNILTVAEILELKATDKSLATGSIIEARLDKGIGPVATVLIKDGTLKIKDFLVAGTKICRVRAMTDWTGKSVKTAGPSDAVQVQGFQEVPSTGDMFIVVEDEKLAKKAVAERIDKERNAMSAGNNARSLEEMFKDQLPADMKVLPIIIKADVQGSAEAVKQAMQKLSDERIKDNVKIKIVHTGVGAINESDVMLAATTGAIILGFGVRPESKAKVQAEKEKIDIRTYSIIYDAIDDINAAISGMIAPTYKEVALGNVEIRNLFKITGVGMIAGCYVLDGKIERNCGYRLLRDNIVIHTGKIASLKRMKDDVKEVNAGYECGVGLDNYSDFKVGDVMETYLLEEEKVDE